VIEYLKTPPGKEELRALVKKLGIAPEALVRKGEDVYKEKYAGKRLTDEQWLDALAADPILIERPIVVKGNRAVIGRPPEKVLELL
jgi:arsenate reductase